MSVGLIEFLYFVDGIILLILGVISLRSKIKQAPLLLLFGIGILGFAIYNVIAQPETVFYSTYLFILPFFPVLVLITQWRKRKAAELQEAARRKRDNQ